MWLPRSPCRGSRLPLSLRQFQRSFSMRHLKFLPDETNINFIGWRYYAFALDGILMLIAIVSIAERSKTW